MAKIGLAYSIIKKKEENPLIHKRKEGKAMKKISFVVLVVLVVVSNLILKPALAGDIPLPDEINIVAPEPDLAKEIAAFSGKWKGIWNGVGLEAMLIVEEINDERAKVIYAWGEGSRDKKGYSRFIAKVIPGSKKIEFGRKGNNYEIKFIFEMKKDLRSIKGTREFYSNQGNFYSTITMKKVD
jgi:hypothetical protein